MNVYLAGPLFPQLAREIVKVLMGDIGNHRPPAQLARRPETIHNP